MELPCDGAYLDLGLLGKANGMIHELWLIDLPFDYAYLVFESMPLGLVNGMLLEMWSFAPPFDGEYLVLGQYHLP